MNNGEILQDFRRRYENTYIKVCVEQKGIEAVGFLYKVSGDDDKFARMEIKTAEFGVIQTTFGSEEYQIKFESPPTGAFQHGSDSILFRRRPERQYTRGICSGNSILTHCHANITGNGASFTIERIKAAFQHRTLSFKEAMAGLRAGLYRSVALKDNFSISLPMSKDKPNHLVWHWGAVVASVDGNGKLVRVYEPVFEKVLSEVIHG